MELQQLILGAVRALSLLGVVARRRPYQKTIASYFSVVVQTPPRLQEELVRAGSRLGGDKGLVAAGIASFVELARLVDRLVDHLVDRLARLLPARLHHGSPLPTV